MQADTGAGACVGLSSLHGGGGGTYTRVPVRLLIQTTTHPHIRTSSHFFKCAHPHPPTHATTYPQNRTSAHPHTRTCGRTAHSAGGNQHQHKYSTWQEAVSSAGGLPGGPSGKPWNQVRTTSSWSYIAWTQNRASTRIMHHASWQHQMKRAQNRYTAARGMM